MASIDYLNATDSAGNYVFDVSKIDFNNTNPVLKINRPSNLLFLTNFNAGTFDAKYSKNGGSLVGVATGSPTIVNKQLVLSLGKKLEYAGPNNFDSLVQTGCIRMRFTPNYTGNPSGIQILFVITQADASSVNLIILGHDTTGALILYVGDSVGAFPIGQLLGSFSPVSGQEYEVELNFDLTVGATRVFIGGTQTGATLTATATRSADINLLRFGQGQTGSYEFDGKINDLQIFSAPQHVANYTPSVFRDYPASASIVPVLAIQTRQILALTIIADEPSGSNLGYTVDVDGVEFYWNGSTWLESTGQVTAFDATPNWPALVNSNSEVKIKFYLESDGDDTPTLYKYTLTYAKDFDVVTVSGNLLLGDDTLIDSPTIEIKPTGLQEVTGQNVQVLNSEPAIVTPDTNDGAWAVTLFAGIQYKFKFKSGSKVFGTAIKTMPVSEAVDYNDIDLDM